MEQHKAILSVSWVISHTISLAHSEPPTPILVHPAALIVANSASACFCPHFVGVKKIPIKV
jgi:hypothetical protein